MKQQYEIYKRARKGRCMEDKLTKREYKNPFNGLLK